jgi:hypothetical protein
LLTRMARSACALTACEPVVKLTWGGLTLACSPSLGTDGKWCAFGRSAGLPGRRASRPGLGRARGPARRAGPQDHLPIGEGSVVQQAHRTGVVERNRKRLGDGYPGCHVVSWAGQVDGGGSRGLAGVWSTQKGRINRSRWAGPDLAPCIGVRPARPVYENTCRTTRERLVGGIATRKGQASRGPGPVQEIGSHSAEELLAGARLGLASDIRAHRRPITA